MPKKTLFLAQLFITFGMAFSMSGIMGFISAGTGFLSHWPLSFITAWPIAFIMTQIVTPLAFKLAHAIAPAPQRL